ncbi:cytochrome c-type biogenesis protein CcmE homolog, mitochondrial isoform X4 [Panicum hallii]|uniref:cytochrome c-type biogenesis protein CcmE homolog, mitochondrial isoform X4 n=1 Tax=Panicum hallii TaxID=206008 RepID=UPI000DF4DD62|nr:cytochrome c-type biogenesis protein CcmE homolog, mitochondrial isoform X4 [Panicum hallii]
MAFSRLLPSRGRLLSALLHNPGPIPIPTPSGAAAAGTPASTPLAPFLRSFASATRRAGPSSRPRAVDIGARARQLQTRRLWSYGLAFACAGGFVVAVLATFQDQLVFYVTPTDALAKFAADPSKSRVRLGGLVLEGSVAHPSPSSPEIEFVVTDLITDVLVRYDGALPDLFREGHSVVVEGFLKPFTDDLRRDDGRKVAEKARECACFLRGTEVLAKHDEKYMPKEVGEALERNKKQLEADAEAAAAAQGTIVAAAAEGAKASSHRYI